MRTAAAVTTHIPLSDLASAWGASAEAARFRGKARGRVFAVEERGRDLFAAVERLDLEGIVAKRKQDPYDPKTVWYKVKNQGYTQADGRWQRKLPYQPDSRRVRRRHH